MLRTLFFCCLVVAMSTAVAQADEAANRANVAQLYGAGVHSYFAGEYKEALTFLSAAADDTEDPRVFYFLGLAQKKLGQDDDADANFARGAKLEAGDTEGLYNCSRALERVQGTGRLTIQLHRAKARLERSRQIEALRLARYKRIEDNQPNVVEGARSTVPGNPFNENAGTPDIPKVATRPVVRPEVEPPATQVRPTQPPQPVVEQETPQPAGGKSTTGALGKVIGEWIGDLIPEMPAIEPPSLPGLPGIGPGGGQPGFGPGGGQPGLPPGFPPSGGAPGAKPPSKNPFDF